MFANVRLVQGASNHVLGVPTGLLQARSDGVFSGGVVRVETTSSDYLNALYPGEITTLLARPPAHEQRPHPHRAPRQLPHTA